MSTDTINCEAVWIAGGKPRFLYEAHESAISFRRHHPTWQLRLITPNKVEKSGVFNHVSIVPYNRNWPWYLNLVEWYQLLPDLADHVYLFDTDTYVCGPLDGPLRLLQRFDFLACHAPGRKTASHVHDEIGTEFPEINIGFVAFNGNDSVKELFRQWRDLYIAHQSTYKNNDQAPLRDALLDWRGSFYILPPEYNYRFMFGGQVRGFVYVLHGRSPNIEKTVSIINSTKDIRSWRVNELKGIT